MGKPLKAVYTLQRQSSSLRGDNPPDLPDSTLTDTRCLVLGETSRTLAGEATDGVHTQELAVVLFGGALIQI